MLIGEHKSKVCAALLLTCWLNFFVFVFSRFVSRNSFSSSNFSSVSQTSRARFSTYSQRVAYIGLISVVPKVSQYLPTCDLKYSFISPHLGLCGFFRKIKRKIGSRRSRSQSFNRYSWRASVRVISAYLSSSISLNEKGIK